MTHCQPTNFFIREPEMPEKADVSEEEIRVSLLQKKKKRPNDHIDSKNFIIIKIGIFEK